MKQKKQMNKIIVSILLFCMVAMYGLVPPMAQAASLTNMSDLISTSAPLATADHIITFNVATDLVAGDEIWVDFNDGLFTGVDSANVTCPAGSGSATDEAAGVVSCTATGAISSAATLTFSVDSVDNPAKILGEGIADTYRIHVETRTTGGALIDRADAMVAIVEQVVMSATVLATLEFTISGVEADVTVVPGVTTTDTSTATTTAFGTLSTAASSTMAQRLNVTTNAGDGYIVTVEQDHELLSSSNDTINSFNNQPDGSGTTADNATAWVAPAGTLDSYETYGHMGLTSSDDDVSGTSRNFTSGDFYGSLYAGLDNTQPMTIMDHDGPSDGERDSIGSTTVAYTIEITPLQEAGDYTNTLTYICTPTY